MCGGSKLKTLTGQNVEGTIEVTSQGIKWNYRHKHNILEKSLPFEEVIAAKKEDNESLLLVVHYIVKHKTELVVETAVLSCIDEATRDSVCDEVQQSLLGLDRPRRLLVIVNPESGAKKGVELYGSQIAPMFALYGVKTNVIVTEEAGEATKLLTSYDLLSIDGVVAVGGDGTFTECVTGLMNNAVQDTGWYNDVPPEGLPTTSVSLGFISSETLAHNCGECTGNGMAICLSQTKDVVTCTLHIILGHQDTIDIQTLHQGNSFLGYSTLLAAYGFISDAIHFSETNRQMGRLRYAYCMLKSFFNIRPFPAEISIRQRTEDDEDVEEPAQPVGGDIDDSNPSIPQIKKYSNYQDIVKKSVSFGFDESRTMTDTSGVTGSQTLTNSGQSGTNTAVTTRDTTSGVTSSGSQSVSRFTSDSGAMSGGAVTASTSGVRSSVHSTGTTEAPSTASDVRESTTTTTTTYGASHGTRSDQQRNVTNSNLTTDCRSNVTNSNITTDGEKTLTNSNITTDGERNATNSNITTDVDSSAVTSHLKNITSDGTISGVTTNVTNSNNTGVDVEESITGTDRGESTSYVTSNITPHSANVPIDPSHIYSAFQQDSEDSWKIFPGTFVNFIMFPSDMSGKDKGSRNNGVGMAMLTLKQTFPRIGALKTFTKMMSLNAQSSDQIKIFRDVREVRVRAVTEESRPLNPLDWIINKDGEVCQLPDTTGTPEFRVKVHTGKVRVFSY